MPRLNIQLIALLLILAPGCKPSEDGLSMPSWDEDNDGVRNECDVDYLLEHTEDEVIDYDLNGVLDSCQGDYDEDGIIDGLDYNPLFPDYGGGRLLCDTYSYNQWAFVNAEYVAWRSVSSLFSAGFSGHIRYEYDVSAHNDDLVAEISGNRERGVQAAIDGMCEEALVEINSASLLSDLEAPVWAMGWLQWKLGRDGLSFSTDDLDGDGIPNLSDPSYDVSIQMDHASVVALLEEDSVEFADTIATYVVRLQSDILSQLVTMGIPVNIIP